MTPHSDILVVGAGPVGLATAICARQLGLQVHVVDKRRPPIDKACGEGLMPAGVAALQAMGVVLRTDECSLLHGIRYIDGPWQADGRFGSGVGWGVRRLALVRALRERAVALGAVLHQPCAMHHWQQTPTHVIAQTDAGPMTARYLIGADGLHSHVRAQAGLQANARARRRRFGVRRHVAMTPWSSHVEVHWLAGAEAYVTPVGPQQVNIALLWDGDGGSFKAHLQRFTQLADRLTGANYVSEQRGAGPFAQSVPQRLAGRVALVGDAAGYLDALTGEGLTLGFRCASALTHILSQGQPLSHYETAYRRLSADYYRRTTWLLAIARRPWLRRALTMGLATLPGAFDALLAWHGDVNSRAALTWPYGNANPTSSSLAGPP